MLIVCLLYNYAFYRAKTVYPSTKTGAISAMNKSKPPVWQQLFSLFFPPACP